MLAICIAAAPKEKDSSIPRPTDLRWSLSLPVLGYPVGMSVGWLVKVGEDRAANRELLVEEALKRNFTHIFFLDDDTVIPNFAIRYLHAEVEKDSNFMVCGGIYCTKEDYPSPIVFKTLGGGPFYKWKVGDVFECAGLGTGCMLIKAEVFKYISKPWFQEPDIVHIDKVEKVNGYDIPVALERGTDDLYFCKKVTEAGFKIIAHGGVLPVHLDKNGKMYTLPADSYPCR